MTTFSTPAHLRASSCFIARSGFTRFTFAIAFYPLEGTVSEQLLHSVFLNPGHSLAQNPLKCVTAAFVSTGLSTVVSSAPFQQNTCTRLFARRKNNPYMSA